MMMVGGTTERFSTLAETVLSRPARLGTVRLIVIDGRAGSGKTTFAHRLAVALREAGRVTAVIHTDDLLDGWTSLVAFWRRLQEQVLAPFEAGRPAVYCAYDWLAGRFGGTPVVVEVPEALVVEGVTSAGACSDTRTTLAVRVVAPREVRLARGIARDGEADRPFWLQWMVDEDAYFSAEPPGVFDVIVDGAPDAEHDAAREYVVAGCDIPRAEA